MKIEKIAAAAIVCRLEMLENNDGFTMKNNNIIEYSSGYQVADYGVECKTATAAAAAIVEYNGNCGVWYNNDIYYIDHSFRIATKKQALSIGRQYKQLAIYSWKTSKCIEC